MARSLPPRASPSASGEGRGGRGGCVDGWARGGGGGGCSARAAPVSPPAAAHAPPRPAPLPPPLPPAACSSTRAWCPPPASPCTALCWSWSRAPSCPACRGTSTSRGTSRRQTTKAWCRCGTSHPPRSSRCALVCVWVGGGRGRRGKRARASHARGFGAVHGGPPLAPPRLPNARAPPPPASPPPPSLPRRSTRPTQSASGLWTTARPIPRSSPLALTTAPSSCGAPSRPAAWRRWGRGKAGAGRSGGGAKRGRGPRVGTHARTHARFAHTPTRSLPPLPTLPPPPSLAQLDLKANVCAVKWRPGSTHELAVGSADHRVYLFDARMPTAPTRTYAGHRKAVSYVRFASSGELVSASTDSTLRLWSLDGGAREPAGSDGAERVFEGHANEKNFVGLGGESVCAGLGGRMGRWLGGGGAGGASGGRGGGGAFRARGARPPPRVAAARG